jgi:hypothetical protein
MDLFGKVTLIEIPVAITQAQKAWLDMMVKKGKIAVPPGGSLPEGSVISIFMRTLLWDSQERGHTLGMVPEETLQGVLEEKALFPMNIQITEEQKDYLMKAIEGSTVSPPHGDSAAALFIRVILENAMEQEKALKASDPWADDDDDDDE